jgi:hypothetical protein
VETIGFVALLAAALVEIGGEHDHLMTSRRAGVSSFDSALPSSS